MLGRNVLALAAGAAGGALFYWLRMPLAWMLGAMTATAVLALSGARPEVVSWLRSGLIMVLGVLLGSSFSPALLGHLRDWVDSFVALIIYLPLLSALGYAVFRYVGRLDPTTSYFSGMPGGLSEMVTVGTEQGGDTAVISLLHAIRVFTVVMLIPFYFRYVEGLVVPSGVTVLGPTHLTPLDALLLLGCIAIGGPLAGWLRLPASQLLGPMLLSAGIHFGGLTDGKPPAELVAVAQIGVGAALGCRFAGLKWTRIARIALLSLLATLLMLSAAALTSKLIETFAGISAAGALLAFAPGGLAEMSLVALGLGIDTAYVATMHLVRVILVVIIAPLAWKLLARR